MSSAKLLVCLAVCLLLFDTIGTAHARKLKRSEKKVSKLTSDTSDRIVKLSANAGVSLASQYGQNEEMIYELVDKLIAKIHMLNKLLRTKMSDNPQCLVQEPYGNNQHQQPPPYSGPPPPTPYQPEYGGNAPQPHSYNPPVMNSQQPPMPAGYEPVRQLNPVTNQYPHPPPQPSEPTKHYPEQAGFFHGFNAESNQNEMNQRQPPQQQLPQQQQYQPQYQASPQPEPQQPVHQPAAGHHFVHQHHLPAIKYSISVPIPQLRKEGGGGGEEVNYNQTANQNFKRSANFNGKRQKQRLRTSAVFGVNKNQNQNLSNGKQSAQSNAGTRSLNSNTNGNRNSYAQKEKEYYERLFNTNSDHLPRYIKEYYQLQKAKYNRLRGGPYQQKRDVAPQQPAVVPTKPRHKVTPASLSSARKRPAQPLAAQAVVYSSPRQGQFQQSFERQNGPMSQLALPSMEALNHHRMASQNQPSSTNQYEPTPHFQQQMQQGKNPNQPTQQQQEPNPYQPAYNQIPPPPDHNQYPKPNFDQPPSNQFPNQYQPPNFPLGQGPPHSQPPNPFQQPSMMPNYQQGTNPPYPPNQQPNQPNPYQPGPSHPNPPGTSMTPQQPVQQHQSPQHQPPFGTAGYPNNNQGRPGASTAPQDEGQYAKEYERLIESLERASKRKPHYGGAEESDEDEDEDEDEEEDEESYSGKISKKHKLPDRYKSYLDKLESSLATKPTKSAKKKDFRVENLNFNKNKHMAYLKQRAKELSANINYQKLQDTEEQQVYQVDDSVKSLLDAIGYGDMFEGQQQMKKRN